MSTASGIDTGVAPDGSLGIRPLGTLFFLFACAAAAVVFWSGLESLLVAWARPEYSHGPLIPLVSGYLFLHEMRRVPPVAVSERQRWPGVIVVFVALAIGLLGQAARIPDISTYGFILWVGGMILICFGARRGILFWAAVLHLVYMLPLPQFIYWPVSVYLQTVSSQVGVALIAFVGIPVFLDGNVIDLGVYKLQVAEACSGLRYLFPVLSFSYIFALLYRGPIWHKVVLLVSAAPITVLMNSFRIGVIGVLVDNFGIEQAEGFLHAFEGWIIFIACVAILFGMAIVMQRLTPNPKRLADTLDIDFVGIDRQIARVLGIVPSAALIAAGLIAASIVAVVQFAPARGVTAVDREPLVLFPVAMAEWTGRAQRLEPEIERVLGADDYHSASYQSAAEQAPVDLFVAYYNKQTEGSGIHSPEVCIPQGGWEVSEWQARTVQLASGQIIPVNMAVISKGLSRQVVYYWFEQRGRRLTSDYAAKAYTLWDSAMTGRSDGALIRIVTPMGTTEAPEAAETRLKRFMDTTMEVLPRFVPD